MKKIRLKVFVMSCSGCEKIIEDNLNKLKSVKVKANYSKSIVDIEYDENKITLDEIVNKLNSLGYKLTDSKETEKLTLKDYLKIVLIALGLNFILSNITGINIIGNILSNISVLITNVPTVSENTSLLVLFFIGGLTSFHCVAMCGGINVSQCLAFESNGKVSKNIQYNLGRVLSYTIIGGIVGSIGSVFTLSIKSQGFLYVIIGFFMILMGLNLFGVPFIKKIIPRLPSGLRNVNKSNKGPFVIGMLNGFMPCGPLQSMQIYALSTGSFINGALSMFMFSIGTVPLMYLFGKLGDLKNKEIMFKFMRVSAFLVIFLGLTMSNRGLAILGIDFTSGYANTSQSISGKINNNENVVMFDLESRSYPDLVVKKDVPVKIIINATSDKLNGCNNEIIINEYGIQQKLNVGENIIEFTPTEAGNFRYSCWMGMIRGNIVVIE